MLATSLEDVRSKEDPLLLYASINACLELFAGVLSLTSLELSTASKLLSTSCT